MLYKRAHFIGIGGVGMSAVAKLLKDSGVKVSGSDEEVYPPISTFLEELGIRPSTYTAQNLPPDADLIVIGKNAKLVPETNEQVKAAFDSGKKILSFPEVLGELSQEKEVVAVVGSYGKSTTTALVSHILETAGKDPSFFIGAIPYTPVQNAHMGKGKLFIVEGDEYPSSNTDPRAKFLLLRPSHVHITPLAHDHYNVFPTAEDYLKPFEELLTILPQNGALVACCEGPLSDRFLSKIVRPVTTYGVSHGEFQAKNISWGEITAFDITRNDKTIVRVATTQLGEHNIQNIVGAAALLLTLGVVSPEEFAAGVTTFLGITRRLDKKSARTSIPIFEGFGSSYEKLRSAIEAVIQHFPKRRLIVVFEPHTFSWRNRGAISWYDTAFAGAQKIYIYEPASQGAATHTQLTHEEIVERVKGAGFDAQAISDPKAALAIIEEDLKPNDVVLLSTSGNLGGLIETIPLMAEKKYPAA